MRVSICEQIQCEYFILGEICEVDGSLCPFSKKVDPDE
jgi:hypothetical protein